METIDMNVLDMQETEVIPFDCIVNELSREVLTQGYTKCIDCTRYWDSHGTRYDYEPQKIVFDRPRKFEVVRRIIEYVFDNYSTKAEYWDLFIDGKEYEGGEVMSYQVLKTKVKLDICVGHG